MDERVRRLKEGAGAELLLYFFHYCRYVFIVVPAARDPIREGVVEPAAGCCGTATTSTM